MATKIEGMCRKHDRLFFEARDAVDLKTCINTGLFACIPLLSRLPEGCDGKFEEKLRSV